MQRLLIVCRVQLWLPTSSGSRVITSETNGAHMTLSPVLASTPWWQSTICTAEPWWQPAITEAARGVPVLLHHAPSEPEPPSPQAVGDVLADLSARERAVLALLTCGLSNRAIADHLVIATSTVKWYVKQIFAKLGVHSRTQAVARYVCNV